MHTVRLRFFVVALGIARCLSLETAAAATEQYTIKDVGELAPGGTVEGINNSGQIVGVAPAGSTKVTGWWFDGKKVIDMGACGGTDCRAMSINANGQIVGTIGRDAYIYSDGKFVDIVGFVRPPGLPLAINEEAEVVGWYTLIPVPGEDFRPERHAFRYRGRKLTDLGTLGGKESVATDINNIGQTVGYSSTYRDETHAFLSTHDKMIDLGTLGGTESSASSINDRGQIVGTANVAGSNTPHAFLYADGKMTDLGTLDGQESKALCINQAGQVVGTSGSRGFLYSEGKMIDLSTLLPRNSEWRSVTPRCINDRGQIAGVGIFSDGKPHIFLMTPVP